jgi:UDP-N-acetylglucosamine--N-acetylmuramyl-(pentapeptide) pyrophosphoryl-undecaprenol N-acetylglucosamine transferase
MNNRKKYPIVKRQPAHKKIIISGGGTGGHVFPAIAIADALKRQLHQADILFVGAEGRMEMDKIPEAGYRIIGLPVEGFRRSLSPSNIRVVLNLLKSLRMAGKIILDFAPDVVVGVGGYASGPVLRKAAKMGIPTLIQEQNSYAGITNRLLARSARKICVAYEGMERYFPAEKLVITGNPVRNEIRRLAAGRTGSALTNESVKQAAEKARKSFGLDAGAAVLLVLGGSLGARTINLAVINGLREILESGISVIWQCGKYYYDFALKSLPDAARKKILLKDFITEMDRAYMAADAIVARAGAITISELCLAGKPAILVPSPNVAGDHQTKNAMALAARSAAVLMPDPEAGQRLIPEAIGLLGDSDRMNELSKNITRLAIADSDERIAREVMGIMKT